MSLPKWIEPFKELRTAIKCINGNYYKYEVRYCYDAERKRSMQKTTRLLGKITEKDGFIPSSKDKLRKECENLPKVDIKTYGISALFESLLPDEIASLQLTFGKETTDALLSFALMRWAYQSPIKRQRDAGLVCFFANTARIHFRM
ncbi:hypothetical protein FACS1894126_5610 [Alphaproteobacteria bacterium]|nr:hypothetical protein FACS1894126_5610 [Alphaproteobacteria bacterium]